VRWHVRVTRLREVAPLRPADEAAVGKLVGEINAARAAAGCSASDKQLIDDLIETTTLIVDGTYQATAGHEVVLTVSRQAEKSTLSWSLTLQGKSRGAWLTTYGAAFAPDKSENFFAKATTDAAKFTITREAQSTGWKQMPALFFTWIPSSQQDRNWSAGPTAGIGLEGNNRPSIFLGGEVTYNWNLGFVAGLSMSPEKRLNGQYTEGQTVGAAINSDGLHKTSIFPRFFFAVTLRFGSNPFKTPEASAPKTEGK
jgi:hypothetical protein